MPALESIAWWITVFLVYGTSVACIWFVIHPFAAFWRRVGAPWAYTVAFGAAVLMDLGIAQFHDAILAVRWSPNPSLIAAGVYLFAIGLWLGFWRMRDLTAKRLFGGPELSRTDKGILLDQGAYAALRHPRYVEVMFGYAGFALIANSLAAYVVVALFVPLLVGIAFLEERELLQRFGHAYRDYMARVPRFIPHAKPLPVFLLLTFAATIGLVITARELGFTLIGVPSQTAQLFVMSAMFIPAIAALVVQRFLVRKPLKELGLRFGSWRAYLQQYALIFALFLVNYAIVWAFFQAPDWTLATFLAHYAPGMPLPLPAPAMIAILAGVTFFLAPVMNMIPSLGEEIGWRGFLLPHLLPYGRTKALLVSGVIWGLWHTPMILLLGFGYGTEMWLGALTHFALVTALGVWFGHVWLETKSTVLAAFMHSAFNAHGYGVWSIVWLTQQPLLIGPVSLVSATLCWIAAAWMLRRAPR